ncbi:putative addiction module antidote protein [Oligella ureolytica]
MTIKLTKWDIQDHLKTDEDRQAYFEAAVEEAGDDPVYIAHVLGDIAKSYGMTKLAQETGLTREGLYKSFGKNGNPSFITVSKVAHALGLKITFQYAQST